MIETIIIKCCSCQKHFWVAKGAKTSRCISCKRVNTLPRNEQSRVFFIKDPKVTTANSKEEILPRKKAVLCGVSYYQKKYKLKGTINDVKDMRNLLISYFRFPQDSILQLTEEQDPELIPTRKNIEKALKWLVEGCRSGDSLVFYFAGHGSQVDDSDGDEIDELDETICPLDFQVNGKIVDDYINSVIVRPLVEGVTLHAIIDTCHSATMLDLPFMCNAKQKKWVENPPPSGANKGTSGGLAICISACRDDQKVVDSSALCGKGNLTYNLIQEINENPGLSYDALITSVQNNIDKAIEAPGCKTWFLRKFFKNSFLQEVQLSSSEKFDIYNKKFKL
ncbi:hypothetical protein JCGZ_24906 [Jatropha curcas]|uniref:Peptidase C14 caspase domain-containing protein n=1 Tax=Jatropha curcas TaxID=180498 RepID=A0A067KXN3_JATCU|nr:metacaspase-1 [Jatropha curcas]KDP40907.1 hypothetical protein JCGZ_24906 [Jatropha curcas]